MSPIARQRITDVATYTLVFLFVYTASSKILSQDEFRAQLGSFPWIDRGAGYLRWVIPATELIAAILLLIHRRRRQGFYLSIAILAAFTMYLGAMLASGQQLPCSCGGIVGWMSWRQQLAANLFFIAVAIAGLVFLAPKISFYETKDLLQT